MRKFFSVTFKAMYAMLACGMLLLCVIFCFYYTRLPDKFYLSGDAPLNIRTFFRITAEYDGENADTPAVLQALSSTDETISAMPDNEVQQVRLKLFGLIPIKEVELERIDRPVLVPLGTPFGIKIKTEGAVVTGFGNVDGEMSPAQAAGIRVGDVIRSVNGFHIEKSEDITRAVQLGGGNAIVDVLRDSREMIFEVSPVSSGRDNVFRMGVWVRVSSAGIGTMSFYDPESGMFGGLGHGVCDVDTGRLLPISSGEAVSVTISGIVKGRPGNPGELAGTFLSRVPIGTIQRNTAAGVFGMMNYAPTLESGIPMAFKQEVKTGPATILSTVAGTTPKEYEIMIERLDYNENNQVKNMVIRITDEELLGKTGGIVQGMSGSPIIQNDKLVGAVTHVFVSDSARGYAIFAENMYRVMRGLNGEWISEVEPCEEIIDLGDAA
ncbi:MAG: SpoIVB peptidase [Oscillospiraceae bacterium]|nr:SpoIVB peptidase [Oscillospiraceae bacterium]